MQPSDLHPHVMFLLACWAAIGPLVGISIGQYLSKSWQREQWTLDNKKQEYRELLATITSSYGTIIRLQAPGAVRSADEEKELHGAQLDALAVLRDRLFIARNPTLLTILRLWQDATRDYDSTGEFLPFRNSYNNIHAAILGAADRDLQISKVRKNLFQRMREHGKLPRDF